MFELTFKIYHNEISLLTFEPYDTWKSPQTLKTKHQLIQPKKPTNQPINQPTSQSITLFIVGCLPVLRVLLCLQVNLSLLSAPGPLMFLNILETPDHPPVQGGPSSQWGGHNHSLQNYLKHTVRLSQ